jgi:hypothetical protein
MMSRNRSAVLGFLVGLGFLLPACSFFTKPANLVADPGRRKEIIDALASNPAARAEVIDRLVGPPEYRAAVIDRILKDESAAGDLVAKIMQQDRGKAIVASKVAADPAPKTFIRMLMLTGVMGESMTQQQADALGLGEPFAYGNQSRTMHDLKTIGTLINTFAKKQAGEDGPHYPVCYDFAALDGCLGKKLPAGSLDGLRTKDAWGHAIQYHSDREGKGYILVSYASDGKYDELGKVGPTQGYDCDIVFSDEGFIQWPGWIRRNEVR